MKEVWRVTGAGGTPANGEEAVAAVVRAHDSGHCETLFESDHRRTCFFITNGDRVMTVLMNESGDPGEHAVHPAGEGSSSSYILSNGLDDEYADHRTVPWIRHCTPCGASSMIVGN